MTPTPLRDALRSLEMALVQATHATVEDTTFYPVMDRFHDIVHTLDVWTPSEPTTDPWLAGLLTRAAAAVYPPTRTVVAELLSFRIPDRGFRHGVMYLDGRQVVFFWFDARQQGLAVISEPDSPAQALVRLTLAGAAPHPAPVA